MNELFEIIAGTVRGREHERLGQNSQDGLHIVLGERWIIAVVCDGCGSSAHSEVGAKLGGVLVSERIREALECDERKPFPALLEEVRSNVLSDLSTLAARLGSSIETVVCDFLLFTVVGAIITPERTCVFSHGDGVIAMNGETRIIDYENTPPYLAYELIRPHLDAGMADLLGFRIGAELPTSEIDSIMLATDGLAGLTRAEQTDEGNRSGEIARAWEHERFFTNPVRLRRELTLAARERTAIDWNKRALRTEKAVLDDDTTAIVVRRRTSPHGYLM